MVKSKNKKILKEKKGIVKITLKNDVALTFVHLILGVGRLIPTMLK